MIPGTILCVLALSFCRIIPCELTQMVWAKLRRSVFRVDDWSVYSGRSYCYAPCTQTMEQFILRGELALCLIGTEREMSIGSRVLGGDQEVQPKTRNKEWFGIDSLDRTVLCQHKLVVAL
jgi:hypothetical protein